MFQYSFDLINNFIKCQQNPPFSSLYWNSFQMKWIGVDGFELKLIQTLGEYFNFSYELINCNNVWGALAANGSWNGLMGLLLKEVR